jgi:hypothetical protein
MAVDVEVIWVKSEPEYFLRMGLDTDFLICPSGNHVVSNESVVPRMLRSVQRC